MSTKIKNTLFRFATMRAPELIEKELVNQQFVLHPENDKTQNETFNSSFLQAASHYSPTISKRKSLGNAADAFQPSALTTREALHESNLISKEYYEFALWLTKNRSKLNLQEVNDKIIYNFGGVVGPQPKFDLFDESTLTQLWDNLFYQIVTYKSGYVREALLSVLVADFFIKNFRAVEPTNAALQKLAQARIVIPKLLFEKEDTSSKKEAFQQALEALPINTKNLDKEMDLLLLQKEIESQKVIVSELKKAQSSYKKTTQNAYDIAKKEYDATVANLYATAETVERIITDAVTKEQKTVTEYVNLQIPAFEFQKEPELQGGSLTGKITGRSASAIDQFITVNEFETYEEVISSLEQSINQATEYLLANTASTETIINIGGFELSTANTIATPVFTIAASSNSGNSSLMLLFNDSVEQSDIVAANYTIVFDDETTVTNTSYTDSIINNKLTVKTFLTGLNFFDKTSFTITGNFTRTNGTKIQFSGGGFISESTLGALKILPNDSILTYVLRGNGKYSINTILDTGDGEDDSDSGTGTGGNTSTNDGSVVNYIPSGFGIKQVGILDYRKVEQEVCCYVPGEVSHIENIMASEYKDRTTRSLQRREETNSTTAERETEKLTDTTTNNRFEMNQEVSSLLAEDTHIGMNTNFNSSWNGPGDTKFGLNIGGDFATNTTKEESNNQAVTTAKDVTERALDRIVQKVKEERIVKVTNEFEETNSHGFDNRKNNSHISGVYRWIDKVYKNKIVNYGKRLMYEFMIPEPAAFHNLASTITNSSGEVLQKPVDPRAVSDNSLSLKKIDDLDWFKASYWAKELNALIEENPNKTINFPLSFSADDMGINTEQDGQGLKSASRHFDLKIPDNYQAIEIKGKVAAAKGNWKGIYNSFSADIMIAETVIPIASSHWSTAYITSPVSILLTNKPLQGEIPISTISWDVKAVSGSLIATCELTPEAYKAWQIKTFNAIITAYEQKLEEYNQKLKQLKSEIKGTNPGFYRQIENTVLRKNCIEYLNSHELTGKGNFLTGTSVDSLKVNYDSPELETYAAKVKFFEQAFEWNNMSYNFYPMYWGEKAKWQEKYNVEEYNDPTFRAFLQSGMARVMVTIRPGFEEAVNWYMTTGQIWNGGQVPTVNDPLFLSIVDELRETTGEVEETWETRIPTSLTVIQAGSIGLDVEGLPCDEDCADYKLFDSDGQPVLDGNGKQISTNPIKQNNGFTGETQNTPPIALPENNDGQNQEM